MLHMRRANSRTRSLLAFVYRSRVKFGAECRAMTCYSLAVAPPIQVTFLHTGVTITPATVALSTAQG